MSYEKDEQGSGCRIRKSYSRKRGYNEYFYDCDEDLVSGAPNFFSKQSFINIPNDNARVDDNERIFGADFINTRQKMTNLSYSNSEKYDFIFEDPEIGFITWMNGSIKEEFPSFKTNSPKDYDFNKHYGTHDWIAESALVLLHHKIQDNEFINYIYENKDDLKLYFLIGTDAPDRFKTKPSKIKIYSINTNKGRPIINNDVPVVKNHENIYDDKGNLIRGRDFLSKAARDMGNQVKKELAEGNQQRAAFFLGAMCHYIADTTIYNHVIERINRKFGIINFMAKVNTLTNNAFHFGSRQIVRKSEFFNIKEANEMIRSQNDLESINPYEAAEKAGRDTRMGIEGESFDPSFLDQFSPQNLKGPSFWIGFNHLSKFKKRRNELLNKNDKDLAPVDLLEKHYFSTIEHNLNMGVYYCVTAMNWALKSH